MPTVLQINVAINTGSTGRIVQQINRIASEHGWSSYTAHGARYTLSNTEKSILIGNRISEYIHGGLYSLLLDKHGLGSVYATKSFIKTIENTIRPDIIHLHNIHGYYINYHILFEYLRHKNIPVIWTLHDCWSFTGHCAYFDFYGCNKWKNECRNCPLLKNYPKSLFKDNSQENYNLKRKLFTSLGNNLILVPVSNWLKYILQSSFFKDSQIHMIHNGIDLKSFNIHSNSDIKEKYNIGNGKIILGVASPWNSRKGLPDFIKLRQLLSKNYTIVLVGLSSSQIKMLPPGIIGIQRTQNLQDLASLYSCADVFVNTTYEDNYPTVNLEAIACGTPVITYDTGGSPESITSKIGRVIEKGNIEALLCKIYEICNEDRDNIRNLCRLYAEEHFDREKCFQEYISVYNTVLNNVK